MITLGAAGFSQVRSKPVATSRPFTPAASLRLLAEHPTYRRLIMGWVVWGFGSLAWFVLGFLSPGYTIFGTVIAPYSPISQPISGLGLGTTGPFMNAAFVLGGPAASRDNEVKVDPGTDVFVADFVDSTGEVAVTEPVGASVVGTGR